MDTWDAGLAPVLTTAFRPDPFRPDVVAYAAWILTSNTQLALYLGDNGPGPTAMNRGPEMVPVSGETVPWPLSTWASTRRMLPLASTSTGPRTSRWQGDSPTFGETCVTGLTPASTGCRILIHHPFGCLQFALAVPGARWSFPMDDELGLAEAIGARAELRTAEDAGRGHDALQRRIGGGRTGRRAGPGWRR